MIKVNTEVKEQRIKESVNNLLTKIQENANQGINKTECIFDQDIYNDTLKGLQNELGKTDYTWCIVRTGSNPHTGRPESYSGESYGNNQRRRVLKIN